MSNAWDRVIEGALKVRIAEIANEETEKAVAKMRDRIADEMGALVMTVLRNFDVARMEDRIIITVRNELPAKPLTSNKEGTQ